jgi:hypothetical protein
VLPLLDVPKPVNVEVWGWVVVVVATGAMAKEVGAVVAGVVVTGVVVDGEEEEGVMVVPKMLPLAPPLNGFLPSGL